MGLSGVPLTLNDRKGALRLDAEKVLGGVKGGLAALLLTISDYSKRPLLI